MAEITRKSVLLECLEYQRGLKKLCSVDHQGRIPLKNEKDLFYAIEKKCKIIEELIQALDCPEVRTVLADWQKDVMQNGPAAMKLDGREPEMRFYEG